MKDTWINGTLIRRGTKLMPNLYNMCVDPKNWDSPTEFRPERHLVDPSATKEKMMTFGVGRRSCLGESLAKIEHFLLFANLIKAFEVAPASGKELPSLTDYHDGLTIGPKDCSLQLVPRNSKDGLK